jgi:tetratricopeptide (TPR) repeat protein
VIFFKRIPPSLLSEVQRILPIAMIEMSDGLAKSGRKAEALDAANEAVQLYRDAIDSRKPAALAREKLALVLCNTLSRRLSEMGRVEEALHAEQEAVKIYRILWSEDRKTFTRNLGILLSNMSVALSRVGKEAESLSTMEEAIGMKRTALNGGPGTVDLAQSLRGYSESLARMGRREEAMATATEAVDIMTVQVYANPSPDNRAELCADVLVLAISLSKMAFHEQALVKGQSAVETCRAICRENPSSEVHKADLSRGLSNLYMFYKALGRENEALMLFQNL